MQDRLLPRLQTCHPPPRVQNFVMSPRRGPPQILLIGRHGQVGWELHRVLPVLGPVAAIDFPDIDLCDPQSIRQWVATVRPQIIVNAAAYTSVDKAETDLERAMAINGNAPALLAELARQSDALLVHFSTSCVFDGTKTTPYTESDTTHPINIYGQTKLVADQAIVASACRHLILRTSWLYGLRGKNFLRKILHARRNQEPIRVLHDQVGTPSPARLIAEATAQTLARLHERQQLDIQQLYHLAADGFTTWYGFAKAILTRIESPQQPSPDLQAILTETEPPLAPRLPYGVLNISRICSDFDLVMPDWESALVQVLDELKAHAALRPVDPQA
jgi:dTDP-4-dehydrorhamnose reductase